MRNHPKPTSGVTALRIRLIPSTVCPWPDGLDDDRASRIRQDLIVLRTNDLLGLDIPELDAGVGLDPSIYEWLACP